MSRSIILEKNNAWFYKILGIIIALCCWETAALIIKHPLIVPSLFEIGASFRDLVIDKNFYLVLLATTKRIFITLLIDSGFALTLGIAAGLCLPLEMALKPFETVMRSIPTMGILLLSLIWFDSEKTPIFVSTLIIFPILYRGITNGIKNIDNRLIEMSKTFEVPFMRRLVWFYLPSIKPYLLTAYSTALGLLVKVVVTTEVFGQPKKAIGTEFQIARAQLDTARIFAWCIVVVIFAGVLEHFFFFICTTKKQRGSHEN